MIVKPLEPIVQTATETINLPRTLLQRYNINIDHLDFEYIKTTQNVRELEKIVLILRSGQEGYFPDLTKCAEDRLTVISPGSKILRKEEPLLTRDCMDDGEWKMMTCDIEKWEHEIKSSSIKLRNDTMVDNSIERNYPPIRCQTNHTIVKKNRNVTNNNRIQACDYEKWDKYDADAEITKMELHEERNRDLHSSKINQEQKKLIEELIPDTKVAVLMTDVEKEVHATRFKDRGNEHYRINEYKEAIVEYTNSINMKYTATAFNNRAMAYLKLNCNKKALDDCNECLKIDPLNIKAHLRKAQALFNDGRRHDAFNAYETVLSIDPENSTAQTQVNALKKQLPDLVKSHKFRMKIDEDSNEKLAQPQADEDEPIKDIDFAKLVIPNKIVKNRLPEAMKALGNLKMETNQKMREEAKRRAEHVNRDITILPRSENKSCKPLIQEI